MRNNHDRRLFFFLRNYEFADYLLKCFLVPFASHTLSFCHAFESICLEHCRFILQKQRQQVWFFVEYTIFKRLFLPCLRPHFLCLTNYYGSTKYNRCFIRLSELKLKRCRCLDCSNVGRAYVFQWIRVTLSIQKLLCQFCCICCLLHTLFG